MSVQDAKHDTLPIEAHKFFALEMRYQGATSREIAGSIWESFGVSVHPGSVRNWFAQGGELRPLYDEYADSMNEERTRLTRDYFQANAIKAAKTLMAVMEGRGGMSQVAVAKVFLDRGLGRISSTETPDRSVTMKDFIELLYASGST